jgi:hypothetical protein
VGAPRSDDVRCAFSVRHHVGRIVELRLRDPLDPTDVEQVLEELGVLAASLVEPMILVADYRAASPFSQEVGDAWSRAMRRFNASVERSAVLLDPSNETFNLQFARVVRCAGLTNRCCFEEPAHLRGWLAPLLTPNERAKLDELLVTPL